MYFGRLAILSIFVVCGLCVDSAEAQQRTTAVAMDEGEPRAQFGDAVAIGDEWAFVGEPEPRLFTPSAVYAYRLVDGEWVGADTLTAPMTGEAFGSALSLSGDRLFVGAPVANRIGAVYVFQLDASGSDWTQTHVLQASSHVQGARFGDAVDAAGDLLVVGAPFQESRRGAAYVFERQPDDSWLQADALQDIRNDAGLFGFSVAVAAARVVVGAQFSNSRAGVAYSYRKNASTGSWELDQEFTGSGVQADDRFARSLDASGGRLVAGSPTDGNGVVYAFDFDPQSEQWVEMEIIGDGVPGRTFFGWDVAAGGDRLVVGGLFSSLAHVFELQDGSYALQSTLGQDEGLGVWSVATSSDWILLGLRARESAVLYEATDNEWTRAATLQGGSLSLERIEGRENCSAGEAAGFPCSGISLLSFIPIHELGGSATARLADIWGWTDPETGTEYALVARTDGVAFVDLSDPEHPVLIGTLPTTTTSSTWRDVKVVNDHAVIVADNAGSHGMQVFDLSRLRDAASPPVTFQPTVVYEGINSAHNVATNEEADAAYVVGASGAQDVPSGFRCAAGPHIVDMTDPANPTFAGCYNPNHGRGYTHDAQCIRYHGPDVDHEGRDLCFGADEVGISITDVTDPAAPIELSLAGYPNASYTHQGWLTADHRYFLVDDETDEISGIVTRTRTLVFDVVDLDDPVFVGAYLGETPATDHNLYTRGGLVFESNYRAGLRILDLGDGDVDPNAIREIAHFDVFPADDGPGFDGAWSNYPYFESGVVVVSGIESGLFVLLPSPDLTVAREDLSPTPELTSLHLYPNPAFGSAVVELQAHRGAQARIDVFDVLGRRVRVLHDGYLSAGAHAFSLDASGLPTGVYFIRARHGELSRTATLMLHP